MPETVLQIFRYRNLGNVNVMIVVMDLAKQSSPSLIMSEGNRSNLVSVGPVFDSNKLKTDPHAQFTKNRQSDATVDDINDRPKKASRVR